MSTNTSVVDEKLLVIIIREVAISVPSTFKKNRMLHVEDIASNGIIKV
jgi:hypothetical protein